MIIDFENKCLRANETSTGNIFTNETLFWAEVIRDYLIFAIPDGVFIVHFNVTVETVTFGDFIKVKTLSN